MAQGRIRITSKMIDAAASVYSDWEDDNVCTDGLGAPYWAVRELAVKMLQAALISPNNRAPVRTRQTLAQRRGWSLPPR
jgi:hypothetical protein